MPPKDSVGHKHEFEGDDAEHCSECGKELDENERLEAEAQSKDIAINALKGSESFVLLTLDSKSGDYGSSWMIKDPIAAIAHLSLLKTKLEFGFLHSEAHFQNNAESEEEDG